MSFNINLLCFIGTRLFLMLLTQRRHHKNGGLVYTKYIALSFQCIILPYLVIKYYINSINSINYINNYNLILETTASYLITDCVEILILKDYKYLVHHFISLFILYYTLYIPIETYNYVVNNIVVLELGSSFVTIPIIFRYKILFTIRPLVFFVSRFLVIINTSNLIMEPILEYNIKCGIIVLSLVLISHNLYILIKLTREPGRPL
jgi:hypothetical protein